MCFLGNETKLFQKRKYTMKCFILLLLQGTYENNNKLC
jgi:hypothetical protein